jgi:AAA+ superfamily predicted ATPase
LGSAAVAELHKLFEWAKTTPKGLLLFIDEAEAFLGSRDREGGVSENLRNVLSALLYQTGTQSDHYMLVLATNRPEDLDRAVTDRVDEALHFELPAVEVWLRRHWCNLNLMPSPSFVCELACPVAAVVMPGARVHAESVFSRAHPQPC